MLTTDRRRGLDPISRATWQQWPKYTVYITRERERGGGGGGKRAKQLQGDDVMKEVGRGWKKKKIWTSIWKQRRRLQNIAWSQAGQWKLIWRKRISGSPFTVFTLRRCLPAARAVGRITHTHTHTTQNTQQFSHNKQLPNQVYNN